METADDPYAILAKIAERSTLGERGLPEQTDVKAHWSGIGFTLAGQRFVAPMAEVAELLERPSATRIPGVKPWVRGVANVRGRLLPLIDLEVFFGGQPGTNRKKQRVLALDMGDFYSGVLVSEVHGMQHFPLENFSGDPEDQNRETPFADYLQGAYHNEEQSWPVFSLHALAKDPRFFNAAAH